MFSRSGLPFVVSVVLFAAAPTRGAHAQAVASPASVESPRDARLIYSASLTLELEPLEPTLAHIEDLVHGVGGYLGSRSATAVVIRVPRARFRDTVTQLSGLGEVIHKDIIAKDAALVTVDVEARLRNARGARDRLLELLRGAPTAREVVDLERELTRVTAEIEELQGSPHVVADMLAFPTITLTFGHSDCGMPYTYDERGFKHFKSECL